MPKPDPALLDRARYPFTCEIATRFGDLDVNLHVNNATMMGLYEESRVRFHRATGYLATISKAGIAAMVASCAVEYLGQSYYPKPLAFHLAIAKLGRSSYHVMQLVTQGERAVGFCRTTMVCVREGAAVPIPDLFRENIQQWMFK